MVKRIASILFIYFPIVFVVFSVVVVFCTRSGEIHTTPFMIAKSGLHNNQQWVSLADVSDDMLKVLIASEDMLFFTHKGFDTKQLRTMWQGHKNLGNPMRGCSTISQQTAKNCFTFGSHTWIRKAVEAYFTILIEHIWGKKRILEVYINVAQTGEKMYGIETAAWHYFGIPASQLNMGEATLLACCLPNPQQRNPDWASIHMQQKRASIAQRAYAIPNYQL